MINLAALKNTGEKLIALYLTTAYRPMRLAEIVKALGMDRKHIEDLLKKLTTGGIVVKFTEFDSTFYCTPSTGYGVPSNGVHTPHHWGMHSPAKVQEVHTLLGQGLSRRKAAEVAGVSWRTVYRIDRGIHCPRRKRPVRCADCGCLIASLPCLACMHRQKGTDARKTAPRRRFRLELAARCRPVCGTEAAAAPKKGNDKGTCGMCSLLTVLCGWQTQNRRRRTSASTRFSLLLCDF